MLKKAIKKLGALRGVQLAAGWLMGQYIRLVYVTSRITRDPATFAEIYDHIPIIATTWHGQHFMFSFIRRPQDRVAVMISGHRDGRMNAKAAEVLGIQVVQGSGSHKTRQKGGAAAFRQTHRLLAEGSSIVLTADVPKISRVAGSGIIKLAQLSGRPIVPLAVVAKRRIDIQSWDHSSIALPFNHFVLAANPPLYVPRTLTEDEAEHHRKALQLSLDQLFERAYGLLGEKDPAHA